ncbi:MAG: TolC family protein [Pyrinomonadaceae bacterium]|nr:TolC family protein [Pyrinomonadaceae bacterium]
MEELEAMATQNNPTLAQADAAVRAAEGRRRQAGLWPNPVVGYFAEELAFRNPGETSEHGVFIEQNILLGGKLSKARRVMAREVEQSQTIAEAQRLRVLNSIRVLYFETLGAQRLVELRGDLARLTREAVEITAELHNVGQADTPDQLGIEIEAERAAIELLQAHTDWEQSWRTLSAMIGKPDLSPGRLAGNLEEQEMTLDQETILSTLLRDSPELRVAQTGVARAQAVIDRARAERIPDLFVRGGVGYNYERIEPIPPQVLSGRKGWESRLEFGITLPIFNRNQGGIATAEAEQAIAERDLQRLQLLLRSRFASAFREYRHSQQIVEKYRTQIIPRARRAYEMYLSNFSQMAASYPQVLIAQRTLFQVEVEYARALIGMRQSLVGIRGFLLTGGLEGIARPGELGGEGTEGFQLRTPNEVTGDSDNP